MIDGFSMFQCFTNDNDPQPLSGHRAFATCLEATAQRREGAVDRWDRIGNVGMFRTGVGDFLNANWGGVFFGYGWGKGI